MSRCMKLIMIFSDIFCIIIVLTIIKQSEKQMKGLKTK